MGTSMGTSMGTIMGTIMVKIVNGNSNNILGESFNYPVRAMVPRDPANPGF